MNPIPVQRYLVPEIDYITPEGFTPVDVRSIGGLPHTIRLDTEITLLLVLPNGLAKKWREVDPSLVLSSSSDEKVAVECDPIERVPLILLLKRSDITLCSFPIVAGLRRFLPETGEQEQGIIIELFIKDWEITAGSLIGAGDFGSHISIAWRRADKADNEFKGIPLNPYLEDRLKRTPTKQ